MPHRRIGIVLLGVCCSLSLTASLEAGVNRWSPGPGPDGGKIQALASAPADPAVVYAATENGVSRSLDGGRTWERRDGIVAPGLTLIQGTEVLAAHPTNPGIVYAAGLSQGWRTEDGGATWRRLPVTAEDATSLALVPANPALGFICGRQLQFDEPIQVFGGCTRFTDTEGVRVLDGVEVQSLAITASQPPAVFVTGELLVPGGGPFTPNSRPVTLRSLDLGTTWQEVRDFAGVLATDPRSRRTVWLASGPLLWRSDDLGNTWQSFSLGFDATVRDLKVDPDDPDRLLAATNVGLLRSDDRGETWESVAALAGLSLQAVARSSAGLLVAHACKGVLRLAGTTVTPTEGLSSWTVEDLAYEEGSAFRYLAIGPPQEPGVGVYRATAEDGPWELVLEQATTSVAAAPGGAVYAATGLDGVLYRSADRGETWQITDERALEVQVLEDDNHTALIATLNLGVRRSLDGGITWTDALFQGPPAPLTAGATPEKGLLRRDGRRLVPRPGDPDVVYFVRLGGDRALFASADGGATFTPRTSPPFGILSLAPDPHSPGRIYAGTIIGLWVSEDDGGSWRRVDGGLGPCSVRDVRVDPHQPGRIVWIRDPCVGVPVMFTEDGGTTIEPLVLGIPEFAGSTATNLTALAFDPTTPGRLLVSRFGSGTFTLTLDAEAGACQPTEEVLCLEDQPEDDRFRVTLDFATRLGGGQTGAARTLPLEAQTVRRGGLFYFAGPDNPEVLIKVLNGCGINGHRWVFASAATTVGFTLVVEDTETGQVALYRNPDEHPAEPITDTEAFESCPPLP